MKVLITGITGTAGQAFVRLLHPEHEIVGIDRNENRIAWMKYYYPDIPIQTGDFCDYRFERNEEEFTVIHLAAMKHIDQCETNGRNAVVENVVKTHKLLERATDANIHTNFIYMSTDKACDPTSIYGYSKRLAEELVLGENSIHFGSYGFVVRSGNIYGSNGSVVPLWEEAIQNQKPIMLTDDSMKRYFITPDHLAQQTMTAWEKGPRIFVPEMDMHVTIGEILDDVLLKYGYTRENYPGGITVTGLRPGEKMEESLHAERR